MASKKNSSKRSETKSKKTRQGNGKFSKYAHNKKSKLYKKRYKGQGK